MANNRLYIVNSKTKHYLCIAKNFGRGWGLGNVDLLKTFLENIVEGDKTNLVIGRENDKRFCEKFINDGVNLNTTNKREYK